MKIEDVIALRVAEERARADVSQDALGKRLEGLLGKTWSRQAVSSAEKGRRAFTAVELVALAYSLDVPILSLLTPPFDVAEIDLPTGVTVPFRDLTGDVPPPRILESLRRLEENAARRSELEQQERDLVDRLIARVAQDEAGQEEDQ